tara:strand:- start:112 stop:471 length:360 start_codon:yes stop_codon:yes gene_type:complete
MKDYENFNVWVEDVLYSYELSQYDTITPQDVFDVGSELIKRAEATGLENCSLVFKSQLGHYDDYLDEPTLSVRGYRKLNSEEKEVLKFEDEVERVSKDRGIHPYQARKLLELKRDGVIS